MFKIRSISDMENELLASSNTSDIVGARLVGIDERRSLQNVGQLLTKDEVKRDVSTYARVLINVYCGWPFHKDIVKRKVLKKLLDIYHNDQDMTALDLFDKMKDVVAVIPDNHIWLGFNDIQARCSFNRNYRNVGKNLAKPNTLVTELRPDNTAVIAFRKMYPDKWVGEQLLAFKDSLDKSSALIVDLRGNGGGSSQYSDELAKYLYGDNVRSTKRTFVRNNPDAARFLPMVRPDGCWWDNIKGDSDPLGCNEKPTTKFNADKGYVKPIYILTDGHTGSSSEMFLLRMIHHPYVRVVGDNSAGMERFGNMGTGFLPVSNIIFSVGLNYRELEFDNFELHGYKPNILCKDGQDAFDVAIADLVHQMTLGKGSIEK